MNKVIIYSLYVIFLSSCAHYYYAPNSHNVPLLQKKGELRLSGVAEEKMKEIQVAASITNNLAIVVNRFTAEDTWNTGSFASLPPPYYNYQERTGGKFTEAGLGYYDHKSRGFIMEVFGGGGAGTVRNQYEYGLSEFSMSRIYLQPDIGFRNDLFEAALSLRFSYLKLKQREIAGYFDDSEKATAEMLYAVNHPRSFLVEPALTLRIGYKVLSLQLQAGYSYNLTSPQLKQIRSFARVGGIISLHKDYFSGKPKK